MTEVHSDAYFDNMQLMHLVSSAETIFKHIYDLVSGSPESQSFIDQWLCYKQEFDTCSGRNFDSNGNLRKSKNFLSESSAGSDEVSQNSVEGYDSGSDNEQSEYENDRDLYSAYESEFRNTNELSKALLSPDFVPYQWINNMNCDLLDRLTIKGENQRDQFYDKSAFSSLRSAQLNTNSSKISWSNLKNESFQFCRYCANETTDCYPPSSMPAAEQIPYLREIKEPLLKCCRELTNKMRQSTDEVTSLSSDLFLHQEVLALIDTSIEIKNHPSIIERKMDELISSNYLVYSVICNCLKMLSINELRYIFVSLINKIAELRVNSSPLDKLILQLDNVIVDKEIRLRYLNKNYVKLRDMYLHLRGKTDNPRSTIVRDAVPDDLDRLIAARGSNANIKRNSDSSDVAKDENAPLLPLVGNIPNRNLRTLQRNTSSTVLGVKRQEKKLIIHSSKNAKL